MKLLRKTGSMFLVLTSLLASSQNVYKLEDNTYCASIYDEPSILELKKTDSISELVLYASGSKYKEIDLRSPSMLKHLSIHDPELYVFIDSFPNMRSLGIEAKFKGKFPVKFDPKKITNLSIYNFTKDEFSFLRQFSNVDTVSIGFRNNYDVALSSLVNAGNLKCLELYASKKGGVLSDKISLFKELRSFSSNIPFNETNLEILKKSISIREITFSSQTILMVPENFKSFSEEICFVFQACKLDQATKDQIRSLHKNVNFKWR